MMKQKTNLISLHPRRGGATLIEVLMAILIMSIGIVSIATLFPISVLRSVHATQLTNGTILRFNAESWIDIDTDLVLDPDQNANYAEHNNTNYIIDPLGWNIHTGATQNNFGNDGITPPAADPNALTRYNFNIATEDEAAVITTLPDNWKNIITDFPTATTATSVTFPLPVDFTGALTGSDNSRIVLIDVDGKNSEVRKINTLNSGSGLVDWTDNVPFTIAQARIETKERMYSYLLSVRNNAVGVAQVDVVVYFRRSFNFKNEQVFGTVKIDADELSVNWLAGNAPKIRKGGYLFDINNGRWHRIQNVVEGSLTSTITLERSTTDNITDALFVSGIVKVYPIGSRP